jgi:adenylylsulfate kinase
MSKGFVVWFTGLSGAGKSTIAKALKPELERRGRHVELLDGDEVRTHLSKGLGFSKEDRDTNIRRIGYVAKLVSRSGGVAITAAISPYREVRDELRAQTPAFVEVFVRCPLDMLVDRDTKGLYKKAIAGEIANFTGVSDPYEEPLHPDVVCDTSRESLQQSLSKVIHALERLGHLDREVRERLPEGDELEALRAEARTLPRLEVGQRELWICSCWPPAASHRWTRSWTRRITTRWFPPAGSPTAIRSPSRSSCAPKQLQARSGSHCS